LWQRSEVQEVLRGEMSHSPVYLQLFFSLRQQDRPYQNTRRKNGAAAAVRN
jgi:hypothetical protein